MCPNLLVLSFQVLQATSTSTEPGYASSSIRDHKDNDMLENSTRAIRFDAVKLKSSAIRPAPSVVHIENLAT
ncbi:hypothetical protein P8C59_008975 [Phyllachora maydis]|uniref:Secreted protein n=1 Tax=Phyllachora maydis TaxID=1825666 RepID=A0AAD9IBP9_9PEZI|nr:hypothetical protein P8C59_008975 [Phyllachora maydis]